MAFNLDEFIVAAKKQVELTEPSNDPSKPKVVRLDDNKREARKIPWSKPKQVIISDRDVPIEYGSEGEKVIVEREPKEAKKRAKNKQSPIQPRPMPQKITLVCHMCKRPDEIYASEASGTMAHTCNNCISNVARSRR